MDIYFQEAHISYKTNKCRATLNIRTLQITVCQTG